MIKLFPAFTFFFFFLSPLSTQAATIYDDFSASTLSIEKWIYPETGKNISSGKLNIELRAFDQDFLSNQLAFTSPETKDSVSGVFNISLAEHYSHTTGDFVAVGFEGSFYASTNSTYLGNIIAGLYVIHNDPSSNTASVVYRIWNDNGSGWESRDVYTFTNSVEIGSDVTLSIEYDGADRIRFRLTSTGSGGPINEEATWYGPGVDDTVTDHFKRIVVGVGGSNDKGSGHTITSVDDVETAAASGGTYGSLAAYDNFSGSGLDTSKWLVGDNDLTGFCRRDVENSMMVLEAQHDNLGSVSRFQFDNRLPSDQFTNFLQADVIVDPSAIISGTDGNTDRAELRLEAHWFNDTHDGSAGNPYNGEEGLIAPITKIMAFDDGTNIAKAQIYKCTNSDCTTFSEILNQTLDCSITRGQANTLSLEKKGKTYVFTCDDSMIEHTFNGNMYEHSFDTRRFRLRNYAASGETTYAKFLLDNVFTESTSFPWAMFLPAIQYPSTK